MSLTWFERLLGFVALALLCAPSAHAAPARAQDLAGLEVGHWVVLKGELVEGDVFLASGVEVTAPEDQEALQGEVTKVDDGGEWLELLGQRVSLSDKVRWRDVSLADVLGRRVKVEGYYRGLAKFSARTLAPRGEGRDRVVGRVDAVHRTEQGVELEVLRYLVRVAPEAALEHEEDLSRYALVAQRAPSRTEALASESGRRERVDEDYVRGSIPLTDTLLLGLRAEYDSTVERDFDLDGGTPGDRIDDEFNVSGVLVWAPSERLFARVGGRAALRLRQDEQDGYDRETTKRLTEAYVYWSRLLGAPLDLQVGRQDYYDEREWLWDENLDAVRLHWHPGPWRLELAAATTLENGSPREEHTDRYIAHLTRGDDDRWWGAYLVDQRTDLGGRDWPLFAGLRAYGAWLPDTVAWGELAVVRGYDGDEDVRGWGFDVGGTYTPPAAKAWHVTLGYAFGSGDGDPNDGVDRAFRQTGIQDNNDKLGGVTSLKYYGELLEPELSNLHVATLGVGRRVGKRSSADLLWHLYRQDEPFDRLRDTNLDMRPNGTSRELGQELDLVLGHRGASGLDAELVLAAFDPGAAFDDARRAYLVKLQLRYRF